MKIISKTLLSIVLLSIVNTGNSQNLFTKGVNLTDWFQSSSVTQIPFTKYSKQDIENIKSLGADVIRLPLNLHFMTNGAPNYTISPLFFQFLDSAVTWAEQLHIHLILDNHTFDTNVNTPLDFDIPLRKEWIQMANHYKNRSTYILYEVLNEPHGPTTAQWCAMQQTVIDTIRTVDSTHTIVVGPSGFNGYTELQNMTIYSDPNLIYTFHFYDPMIFTHQGASWVTGMDSIAGVPFPYNDSTVPVCPPTLKGTWIDSQLADFKTTGTDSSVKSLLSIAVLFRTINNVRLYCGEYGVYNLHSKNDDRVHWYYTVKTFLQTHHIPWTTWDYQDGFGLFTKNSNQQFNYDLNIPLVDTLGFTAPTQLVYKKHPDSVGFPIYTDYVGQNIFDVSWLDSSTLDYYDTQRPNNGLYCMQWQNPLRYNDIILQLSPVKDMSLLRTNNYALDFMIRSDNPATQFEIRFVQQSTIGDTSSHAWRMSYTIDSTVASFDSCWHHVHIPLSNMKETGAWDNWNNTWSNARGAFDWTQVGYFVIAAEQKALPATKVWLDNVVITNVDTAKINDSTSFAIPIKPPVLPTVIADNHLPATFTIYPNPAKQQTTISYRLAKEETVTITIYNAWGQVVSTPVQSTQSAGLYTVIWQTAGIPAGFYVCRFTTSTEIHSVTLLKE